MTSGNGGLAAYQRVVESIKQDIRSGRLAVGDRLPGQRPLADEKGVSVGTLQKALQVLEAEGWLVAQPAVGVFVNEPPTANAEPVTMETIVRQLDQLQAAVLHLAERVEHLEAADETRPGPPSR